MPNFEKEQGHIFARLIYDRQGSSKDLTPFPEQEFHRFAARDDCKSKTAILVFAKDLVIAPGIVVGRLQHEGIIPFSWHADLKRTFELVA
ncbi:MAG: hypothetical protein KKB30_16560 [Proteobacteria bacterium]|nr:hypothetical protein [Pseudomonadota bacterium]MBU1716656.1 hypothetical protein [Pseudomonadota bacterium]